MLVYKNNKSGKHQVFLKGAVLFLNVILINDDVLLSRANVFVIVQSDIIMPSHVPVFLRVSRPPPPRQFSMGQLQ